jgi:hypothetical protein
MAGNLVPEQVVDTTGLFVVLLIGGGVFTIGYLLQQAGRSR